MSKRIAEEILSLTEIQNSPPIDVPEVQFFTSHDQISLAYYYFATRQEQVAKRAIHMRMALHSITLLN